VLGGIKIIKFKKQKLTAWISNHQ